MAPPSHTASRLGKAAQAGFALWRDAMSWQRAVNRALRPLGLTHTQLLVLATLDRTARAESQHEGVTQAMIAKEAGLDPATTSAVLRALEKRGMASRDVGFDDQRAWRLIPTREGERALGKAAPLLEAVGSELERRRRK